MDNPLRGIALIIGATMFFSTSDAISKILGQRLPAIEISTVRYIVFVVMAAVLCRQSGTKPWRTRVPGQQILRGAALVMSALCFIEALRHLPLADAASIGFVSPMLITALSVPMLREQVGIRRWSAIIVGFIGVLIVIRPGTGAFRPEALWVLASSSSWAVASCLTRKIAGTDTSQTTITWSAVTGLVICAVLAPFAWVAPGWGELGLCVILGILASTGQYLMVLAYRYAGAATLAPFSYVQLAWAVILGWLVWRTLPDAQTWAGTAIIVASGIYIVHRERVRARHIVAAIQ
jgi:drug/metabolite transporter (DMT)-like permease